MVESPDTERAERTRPFGPRLLLILATALVAIGGLALIPGEDASPNQDSSRNEEPRFDLPVPEDVAESIPAREDVAESIPEVETPAADYINHVTRICTAAHARLHEEVKDFGSYVETARRIMGETLTELRAVALPVTVQRQFDHLYRLMEQFAKGEDPPFTSPEEFWIHQIELKEPSLYECTFGLPR